MRSFAILLGAPVLASAFVFACSSTESNGGLVPPTSTGGTSVASGGVSFSSGGNVSIGTGGNGIGINTGGSSSQQGTGGTGTFDGGKVPITVEQEESINSQACAGEAIEGEVLPTVLQLVVDVSSSMNQPAPGSRSSKWEVTRDALLEAIVGVTGAGLGPTIGVGLLFYPNTVANIGTTMQDIDNCVNTGAIVPPAQLGPASGAHRAAVRTAIESAQLQQSTPTHDAYRYAFENGILTTNLPGKKFMAVITDGTPTLSLGCMNPENRLTDVDPEPIVSEVDRVGEAGIRTFLIGSPGSENNRNWMSRAAVLGGTATDGCNINGPDWCHMDMTTASDFSAALRAGLARIVGQLTPCTYSFPEVEDGQLIDQSKINVIVHSGTGERALIVRDDQGECTQGWQLTADKEVLLCPETCSDVQLDPEASVNVTFGCTSLVVPPR